jgi:hypothetical protein
MNMDTHKFNDHRFAKRLDYKPSHMVEDFVRATGYRKDTETGIFASQLVIETIRQLFVHETLATKWATGGIIPIDTSLDAGAVSYAYTEQIRTGLAEIITDSTTSIPMASIEGRNTVKPIDSMGIGIEYTNQQIRTANFQGMFDLVSSKVAAAREGHDIALNNFIRTGLPALGLDGVTNQPGIIVANATTGNWIAGPATSAQIVADVRTAINAMKNASGQIEQPDTVVLPVAEYNLINTQFMNPGFNETTVLTALRGTFPEITNWTWDPGMDVVDAGGAPALLVYRNDSSRMRVQMPLMMAPTAPQPLGFGTRIYFESRFGGVMAPRPRSVLRLDNI